MNSLEKERLHAVAQAHVGEVCARVDAAAFELDASIEETKQKLKGPETPELRLQRKLYEHKCTERASLAGLGGSPYFFRCDAMLQGDDGEKTLYFSKHTRVEDSIFSWVSPAAALRFEPIGDVRYTMPDGTVRGADLRRKDQYLIVDGKIVFMATEDASHPRTLVHQEHFTSQKRGFVLPDIVAQMEKAQDTVIRAPYKGPFLIAGPAGSGKTTLALHRVAYLAQSPDTAAHFPHDEIVVFVQDESAKAYFGALLPELGIVGVTVCTFHEWAFRLLKLPGHSFVSRWSDDEGEDDRYLFAKRRALDLHTESLDYPARDPYAYLQQVYSDRLNGDLGHIFTTQREQKKLDRFDLVILLKKLRHDEGALREDIEYYDKVVKGRLTKSISRTTIRYSLAVVDEAENWLAEELMLFRGCLDPATEAIIYVGDLAQRTQLGTVRSWDEVGERFSPERKVTLQKVYRNTRQILEYAHSLGYSVDIPTGVAEGPAVDVRGASTQEDDLAHCRSIVASIGKDSTVGILAKAERRLTPIRAIFADDERVKLMTVGEAQGLEFDTVILLGAGDFQEGISIHQDPDLAAERRKMDRDLRYVALTRAMRELHVIG